MKRIWFLITGGIIAAAILGGSAFMWISSQRPVTENSPVVITKIAKNETDPAAFKAAYPRHFDSYMKNAQTLPAPLKYANSEKKHSKLAEYPYMTTLWNGYAFAKEYNEARGHVYTNDDVIGGNGTEGTKRIGEKTNLTCMYCKSAEVPQLLEKMGDAFFNTKLLADGNKDQFKHPISCSDCHNPETMELRITRPALTEALARRGVDVTKATQQEMRTYVCAQCHVTYFFNPNDKNRVTFPWDKGFEPEDIYAFETSDIKLTEWTHPQSGSNLIKARHPEFETFQGSVHQKAGLSCADCHMPYMKEGNTKISSHWWTSPMRTFTQSCATCHKQSEQQMKENILNIQDRTREALDRAGEANKAATLAIEKSQKAGADAKLLDEARALHREAQFYWDYVGAENSMGFHNPSKMMETLADSIDLARQAEVKAIQAEAAAKK